MKRFILLILACLPMMAMAQEQALIEKYSTIDGCSTIELSKDMVRSMGGGNGIDTLTAISVEDSSLIAELSSDVEAYTKEMSRIMSVKQSGTQVTIFATTDANTGRIVRLVIYTATSENGVMVILTGSNIELSNASSIMNINI